MKLPERPEVQHECRKRSIVPLKRCWQHSVFIMDMVDGWWFYDPPLPITVQGWTEIRICFKRIQSPLLNGLDIPGHSYRTYSWAVMIATIYKNHIANLWNIFLSFGPFKYIIMKFEPVSLLTLMMNPQCFNLHWYKHTFCLPGSVPRLPGLLNIIIFYQQHCVRS